MAKRKTKRKKNPTDEMPVQIFCNVISDGDKTRENTCKQIFNDHDNPIPPLQREFGKTRVKKEIGKFKKLTDTK
jgi:hypothetical protein